MASPISAGEEHGVGDGGETGNDKGGVRLDIIVIGAGIAGLGAAITLSRAGHKVTVLEKSEFKREAGFMITLGSNAIRVLKSFDFDYVRSRAVPCDAIETSNGHTLEPFKSNNTDAYKHDASQKARTFYRPDLHDELKRLALLESDDFVTPILRLGVEVVDVNVETATVVLKDGTTLSGDLVVGSDGERSLVKESFKDGQLLRQAPYKIFRAIVPTERLSNDERGKTMMAMTNNKFAIFQSLDRTLSWFSGRDGLLQDLEAGYSLREGEDPRAETNPEIAYEKMMERFGDFHPGIVDALKKAERVSDWEVYFSKPLPYLHKHKAVLIGDAAHSMHPTTGQGGSQGIEDVGALGILLSHLTSKSDVEKRLKVFEELRKGRVEIVSATSMLVFGMEKDYVEARPHGKVNRLGINTTEKHMEYLFSYDILGETKKALDKSMRARANL